MAADFEMAQQKIRELVVWATANSYGLLRNEAETRLHLIDELVFGCLGWNREDCSPEESYEGRYADYVLGKPERLAVIEAKREGVYFELPDGFQRRVAKLKTVTESAPQVAEALKQALGYCQQRGIGIGIVCNGHQLIAFLASRQDGVPPLEGLGLIYPSLEQMRDDFRTLWENLSKPGSIARNIYVRLRGESVQTPPEKLSQRIPAYPGFKNRNPFQTELQILGEIVIEDVSRAREMEKDFLERCYCTSGALSQYALISKQILQTRYSSLLQQEMALPNLQPVSDKSGTSKELASDLVAAAIKQRPIILLGDVGVGKTIFIRHLIKVEASDVIGKGLVLYINFGREPALATDLQEFILRRCAAQLLEEYDVDIDEDKFVRGVYHFDLLRFEKGIFAPLKQADPKAYLLQEIEFLNSKKKDRASHLKSCLTHITRARKTPVVVFLDNIDQRPPEFQDQVFVIGQSLAEHWPATVFMSLRPDTFAHSSVKGSVSAYHPRVFTVSPPRVDLVLSKRLAFALNELSNTGRLHTLPPNLTFSSERLSEYLHVLLESFERSEELIEFIDNLSDGNTRQALEFVSDFIGSGHVDAQKIIDAYRESGSYTIPVHEFMRAVLYRDHVYYDPSVSRIANLFDISSPDGCEHFLLPNLIVFVERSSKAGVGSEGYVDVAKIFEFAQALGFQPSQIRHALDLGLEKKLFEANPRFEGALSVTSLRITTIGAYTVSRLAGMFAYADAVVIDTPIVDLNFRSKIPDVASLRERLDRAEQFRAYLDVQWEPLASRSGVFDWAVTSSMLRSDIQRVERRVARDLSPAQLTRGPHSGGQGGGRAPSS
jgi:hypothetical protein